MRSVRVKEECRLDITSTTVVGVNVYVLESVSDDTVEWYHNTLWGPTYCVLNESSSNIGLVPSFDTYTFTVIIIIQTYYRTIVSRHSASSKINILTNMTLSLYMTFSIIFPLH